MQLATFKSDYAILDVKHGRFALQKYLNETGKPVRVRVDLLIEPQQGRDDGTSIEFSCTVSNVREFAR